MNIFKIAGAATLLCAVVACSDTTTSTPVDAGAADSGVSDAAMTDGNVRDADANETDAGTTALKAPELTELMPMSGHFHVMWMNREAGCTSVEGERKSASTPYAKIFSVSGTEDAAMDEDHLTSGVLYTYRVRCVKGAATSPYSNERSVTP